MKASLRSLSRRSAVAMASVVLAAGCASAKMIAFRDPDFADHHYSKIAVFALGMYMENAVEVEKQVCEKVAPAQCVQGKSILPPTRTYSNEEVAQYLAKAGIDGALIVALAGDDSASQYLGTIATAIVSANSTGSGQITANGSSGTVTTTSQGTATGQSVATPMYSHTRAARAVVGLIDRVTGRIAWRGDMKVSGQGELAVSDAAFIRAATDEIAEKLKENGLLTIPAIP